ncbi:glycosyltransferase [Rummeliibacillus stabekisii]|uniref:glycosyltransferase n=1 Tax=Rummeliibacillus stabekisii TaxID=241244 RepID=UPI001167F720|nr:glycosyltransferase [Rummeliibacillus stabekisii]MBB5170451.1 glycosyltransferase involved in cell wall biosynthesis [Rummeliibacillus stabekisii]GEL04706.1 glycosyl transferase family 1 [Rummeliibacillus stabekisii]
MKRTVFMTTWGISDTLDDTTKELLQRASLFANDEYCPVILTMDFKINYDEIIKGLYATGWLKKEVEVINVFDYYRQKFSSKEVSAAQKAQYEQNIKKYEGDYWVQDGDTIARYFQNGSYIKYKQWDEDGVLKFIDYFDENRVRIRKEEYNPKGYKIRETLYHPANNKKNQERFFTPDGFCYCTNWFNYQTDKQQALFLFDPAHKKAEDFSNRKDFQIYWLEELCRTEVVKPVIIVDGVLTVNRVIQLDDDLAYKIYNIHQNHFEAPYTLGSDYNKATKPILDIVSKGFPIVVPTSQQQLDLHKEIGNRGNIHVISPSVEMPRAKNEKNSLLVSMIADFTAENRIGQAIEAFMEVARDIPGAKLEIYGSGEEEDKLKKLIKKLKVAHGVKLKEPVQDTDAVYSKSAVSIVTAEAKGFVQSILESFANGTPVVAYDTNYGPAQLIQNEETGYLVQDGEIEALADRIKKLLDSPEDRQRMGNNAQQLVKEQYTPQSFYENWKQLIQSTIEEDKQKPLL